MPALGSGRRKMLIGLAIVGVFAVAFGTYWFQPWKLWTDRTLREALPSATAAPSPTAGGGTAPPAPAGPQTVASGRFISHEHTTNGSVKLLRLADGSYTLRLEGLETSDGPALYVWLTDAPVKEGRDGWHVFDDGAHVSLGKLKANMGDQNYPLPAGTDPTRYTSVSIWCDRFDVSFGAAALGTA
ncbi:MULTISPECIES: DM13 domain-containing protein [Streptomyces]|uniref:DM13 domain-containing protein n=1 Tax=Streptomyces TaxID=1883 RepID=UPI002F940FCE